MRISVKGLIHKITSYNTNKHLWDEVQVIAANSERWRSSVKALCAKRRTGN